jgi:poly(A) polymerase
MMAVAVPDPVSSLQAVKLSPELQGVLAGLHEAVPDAWLVGGALRDLIVGRPPLDVDVVSFGDSTSTTAAIASKLGGHPFSLDVERGHYRVTLHDDDSQVKDIDVSQIEDIERDLARRDYTVNSIGAPINPDGSLGTILDPFDGVADIENRRLRMVRIANLEDDPLRLLRGVRLAAQLQLEVENETASAIRQLAPRLSESTGERQREELVRLLETPRAAEGIRLADSLGLLDVLVPELAPARGVEQPENHHYYDVFEHSVQALAALDEMLHVSPRRRERGGMGRRRPWLGPDFRDIMRGFDYESYLRETAGGHSRRVLLKLAGLLHDIAKPETKSVDADGRVRFLDHPELGARKAQNICHRLRFGNRETQFVSTLVEEHLRPTQLAPQGVAPSRRALYRFFRDLGDAAPACLILTLADAAAATGPRLQRERWRGHVAYAYYVLYQGSELAMPVRDTKQRLLDGKALMQALDLAPGPRVGEVLVALDEAQALGEVSTRDEALTMARSLLAETLEGQRR